MGRFLQKTISHIAPVQIKLLRDQKMFEKRID